MLNISLDILPDEELNLDELEAQLYNFVKNLRSANNIVAVSLEHDFDNGIKFDGQNIPPQMEAVIMVENA